MSEPPENEPQEEPTVDDGEDTVSDPAPDSEKPKKIKDIRARLGRPTRSPPRRDSGGAVPPPPSSVLPPTGRPASFVAGPAKTAGDPFRSTVPAAGPQEVRIVVDEQAVHEHKEGASKRVRRLILTSGSIAALIGIILGILGASVIQSRREYNRVVRDGKEIYQSVVDASTVVSDAKVLVDGAVLAARPTAGISPSVDYTALEKLRAAEVPFSAGNFSHRRFVKFNRETVDALLNYARLVNDLWSRFDRLANKSLPPASRAALDRAAKDQGAVSGTPTGCVPVISGGSVRCSLVYVDIPTEQGANKISVRATPGGRAVEKEIFAGQDLRTNASKYVIITNPEQSQGVLGKQRNAFVEYRRELLELSKAMDETLEIQGRLETELGNVASLNELFTL